MILNGTRGRKGVHTSQFLSSALHAWNIWVFRSSNKRFLKEIRNLYECEQIYCILNMRNKKKNKNINICLQNISVAFLSMFLVITHFIMINICLQNISVAFLSMFLVITHFIMINICLQNISVGFCRCFLSLLILSSCCWKSLRNFPSATYFLNLVNPLSCHLSLY